MRKPIMAGNWKMNKTRDEALQFIYAINQSLPSNEDVESIIFAPSLFLRCLVKRQGDALKIGAQNVHDLDSGAYTGEISPLMLKTMGIKYVLIGHSERRMYFNECDSFVNSKLKGALKNNLTPVLCCGEKLSEFENGSTFDVLTTQITKAFSGIEPTDALDVIIAYEPVWAIGTGKTSTSENAEDCCRFIRGLIEKLYSKEVSEKVRILYGGSVNTANVNEFISKDNIDGCLVGGASLNPSSFLQLVNACK